ncbi:sigma-70 family RNA polymerase sigma factor [bacterium]|nr:sigma-70 family RNA polymerase sigma factor [bacterium]MBU1072701.1 sigma-70 family RNA polymerase sigma factor [bacterium]MBU1676493.1 sigma-70 family RNA polymerase sigma factor [bacterium]
MQAAQAREKRTRPPQPAPDTARLVRRAQAGDRDAFGELYRLHVDRVFALCLRLTADRDTASLLTQDAFVRAWRNIASFRGESRLLTWLHRVAVNVVLDHRRDERRRLDRQIDLGDGGDPERHAAVPPSPVGTRRDLERAIAGLPAGARTIFTLHEIEGYRMREIAEMAGVAVGTVKAQLHRARRLLREVLT